MYSIEIPRYITDTLEDHGLDLDKEIQRAVSTGLKDIMQAIREAQIEPWQLYRYDEWTGKNKPWHGHTRHQTHKIAFDLSFKLATQAIRVITLCNEREIDPRTLYWTALIQPNIPSDHDHRELKEMLQSNQLPPRQPSTIIALCLWSHVLRHQNIPEGQERLKGVA